MSNARPKATEQDGSVKLAALGLGLLILLQAPLVSFDAKLNQTRSTTVPISPVEGTAMGLLEMHLAFKPLTQVLLVPGTAMKRFSKYLMSCYLGKEGCQVTMLLDLQALWHDTDIEPVLEPFHQHFTPHNAQVFLLGCAVVTIGGIASMWHPVRLGAVGLCLMVYSAYYTAGVDLLPTLIMQSFLGFYVFTYNLFPQKPTPAARSRVAATAAPLAARSAQGSPGPAAVQNAQGKRSTQAKGKTKTR